MPTRLTRETISQLQEQCPGLRNDYFEYLANVGWGETASGRMIYSGPIAPDEIYGPHDDLSEIVLLGDDFQGYCFGYHTQKQLYGEVSDDGTWESWPESEGIACYVTPVDGNAT